MPNCKNCGARLNKLDNDICPVCGCEKPLEGVVSETVDITTGLDLNNAEYKNSGLCNRKTCFLLFAFIGWSGAGYFYIKHHILAIIWLIGNMVLIGGIGLVFAFLCNLGPVGFVISTLISYFLNICIGLYYLKHSNVRDGRGEFIH